MLVSWLKRYCTDEELAERKKALLESLRREGVIRSERVYRAMLRVPREEFVPAELRCHAYDDTPLPIGHGQTISAPHMVAMMCEEAKLEPGHKVLEVGTGSGYHAAVMAEIVAPLDEPRERRGLVVTIERIPELAKRAQKTLERLGYGDRVKVVIGDGSKGYEPEAPYDRIVVTAAAPSIPRPLLDQLKPGGIMVIPVGDRYLQYLYVVVKKEDGSVEYKPVTSCLFVPLVGEHGWKEES
jgi:protein-L-isoaspartate(D-aspartate) O-methyltransferase